MIGDDDYYDEEDYGDEGGMPVASKGGRKKVEEADYDFM